MSKYRDDILFNKRVSALTVISYTLMKELSQNQKYTKKNLPAPKLNNLPS